MEGPFLHVAKHNMKTIVLIDGGHVRTIARQAGKDYNPDFIEAFAHRCVDTNDDERLHRILYYDCPLFRGEETLPISKLKITFSASDNWLDDLSSRQFFFLRLGTLAFRGWVPKRRPPTDRPVEDDDFKPRFQQKRGSTCSLGSISPKSPSVLYTTE